MPDLTAPVQFLKGVGPRRAAGLAKLGVTSVEDLLHHLPMRYEDRSRLVPIADLQPGQRVAVAGEVTVAGIRRARRMPLFEALIQDERGHRLKALWFNQGFLKDVIERGKKIVLFGLVERDAYAGGRLMMSSPEYELVADPAAVLAHAGRVVPVYEKLGPLTGRMLRRLLVGVVEQLATDVGDPLPPAVRRALGVTTRCAALREVHMPPPGADVDQLNRARSPAHIRLIMEEFFLFQLGLARRQREHASGRGEGTSFVVTDGIRAAIKRLLPYRLTGAQKRVLREIAADLQGPRPMNRLLQGDVGCGKTIVALISMIIAVENGYQAAFMAPTEILAEQHLISVRRWLADSPYRVELISAGVKGRERAELLGRIGAGETQIVVGTHALIQRGVRFARLGLAVIDEQHRFGVIQRDALRRKGYRVDTLVMTATPIPRTLALTAYGDLDVSVIDEMPPGRSPVRTLVRTASDRRDIEARVRSEVASGRQVYVVYPLVEESDKLEDVRAATQMRERWCAALPEARVGLLHGRMKSAEKEQSMLGFANGQTDVLVATTVVEVGVDVPNATLMVIEHAERFGLSQLHQLRGRVGRGADRSTCVLVRHGRPSKEGRARIDAMVSTQDGFIIAERDLEIRGPGDFFGTRQWGMPTFRVSHLLRDRDLLESARDEAHRYADRVDTDPAAGALRAFLAERWAERFGLARVG
jgi:ATP-dependent DNA helicase RecG